MQEMMNVRLACIAKSASEGTLGEALRQFFILRTQRNRTRAVSNKKFFMKHRNKEQAEGFRYMAPEILNKLHPLFWSRGLREIKIPVRGRLRCLSEHFNGREFRP